MYEDEPLKDYYTLMDIAYIYTWRRVRVPFLQFRNSLKWSFLVLTIQLQHFRIKCENVTLTVLNRCCFFEHNLKKKKRLLQAHLVKGESQINICKSPNLAVRCGVIPRGTVITQLTASNPLNILRKLNNKADQLHQQHIFREINKMTKLFNRCISFFALPKMESDQIIRNKQQQQFLVEKIFKINT